MKQLLDSYRPIDQALAPRIADEILEIDVVCRDARGPRVRPHRRCLRFQLVAGTGGEVSPGDPIGIELPPLLYTPLAPV